MQEVTLNNKEQKRLLELNEVMAGQLTGQEAADMLDLGVRSLNRIANDNVATIGKTTDG